jgi:poly-beta-1,6 N-acetyl-D-glucosamine synthase
MRREVKLAIYGVLILSYIITAALFLWIYLMIEPMLTLSPVPEGGGEPGVAPVPEGAPQISQRLLLLYRLIRSPTMAAIFFSLFLIAVFLNEFSYIFLAILHVFISRKRIRPISEWKSIPMVSIIVPAHNEEKVIEETIRTLLDTSYPNKEIIVVNDGSTDRTEEIVKPYALRGEVILINRPNAGKAVALNTGVHVANGEIIVAIDADGAVERDAITRLVAHFQDPNVVAVAGNVKVGNRVNLLTKLQALEYIREINLRRRALDLLNTIYVVPGAIGAFRKSAYMQIGWYDRDTVAEDMDVTIKFLKTRGLIPYEGTAIVHTEAPETLKSWFRQRNRWYGGTLQTMVKHRAHWWRHGALSFVGFPYLYLSSIFVPVLEITAIGVGLIYSLLGLWRGVLLYFAAAMAVEFFCSILGILIDREDPKLILLTPIYVLIYRYFVDFVRMKCYWNYYRGRLGWTRAERYGGLGKKIGV